MHLKGCPTSEGLSDYLAGRLSAEDIEAIAVHIEECVPCQVALESNDDSQDVLIKQVRALPPPGRTGMTVDSILASLIDNAKALGHAPQESPGRAGETDAVSKQPETEVGDRGKGRPAPEIKALPQKLDQYLLLDKIGGGGMGDVYRARHVSLDKLVALKIISKRCVDGAGACCFQREVKAIGRLDHQHIIRRFDAREAEACRFWSWNFLTASICITSSNSTDRSASPTLVKWCVRPLSGCSTPTNTASCIATSNRRT